MNVDEHARNIGGLICNLQSIEFEIRCLLSWANYPEASGLPAGHRLSELSEGNQYLAGTFTNYDSLGQLVSKFNLFADKRNFRKIDTSIVTLRDAIAHGRCASDAGENSFRLIKFSKPSCGRVTVTYNQALDSKWYERQRKLLSDALWALDNARQQL